MSRRRGRFVIYFVLTIIPIFFFSYENRRGVLTAIQSLINQYLFIGLGGLCLLVLIILGVWLVADNRKSATASKKFREMRSDISAILIPMGFIETEVRDGRTDSIIYSQGNLEGSLGLNNWDSCYELAVSSRTKVSDGSRVIDFLFERSFKEAEKFKSESIAKLTKESFRQPINIHNSCFFTNTDMRGY